MSESRLLLFAACLIVCGCSKGPAMGKVAGTVTLDGKPLPQGSIIFESPDQRPATGSIVDGRIVDVSTHLPQDGVPVGAHKVAITATEDAGSAVAANPGQASPSANYMVGKSLIPARYNDPATSGLSADIKPGENTLEFQLSSQPAQ